jgi:hypothetical protein
VKQLSLLTWINEQLILELDEQIEKEFQEKMLPNDEAIQTISCLKCGDTTLRGLYEVGCRECGADENKIIIQG